MRNVHFMTDIIQVFWGYMFHYILSFGGDVLLIQITIEICCATKETSNYTMAVKYIHYHAKGQPGIAC